MEESNITLRNETVEFISKAQYSFFITLHFKYSVTKSRAREILGCFIKKLNAYLFGSRSLKSLIQVSVIEKNSENDSFHVHMLCENPIYKIKNEKKRSIEYLKSSIKKSWGLSSNVSATDELFLHEGDLKWIKEVYDIQGVCRYISKQILYGHKDVIEWDTINLSGRRKRI